MLKKYFKDISEGDKLERRTAKEWREKGTLEEAIKMVEFKERKERNNAAIGLVIYIGSRIWLKSLMKK